MGIDRHELEHRNWRSGRASTPKETESEIGDQLDTSIVPSDTPADAMTAPAKSKVKRAKTDRVR